MLVYYLTPTRHVPSILRKGLEAGRAKGLTEVLYGSIGKSWPEVVKVEKSSLYFVEDLESMGELIGGLRYLLRSPTSFTILKVSLPEGSEVEPDERQFGGGAGSLGGFLRSKIVRVPPSGIKVLGRIIIRPQRKPSYHLGTESKELLELGDRSSKLVSGLEEPESEEALEITLRELGKLPSKSRAHGIREAKEERLQYFEDLKSRLEEKED